jgi:hypothetical protein
MQRFFSFDRFLLEKKVPLSSSIDAYNVEDLKQGKFRAKKNNVSFSFSVNPLPKNLDIYQTAFFEVIQALDSSIPSELYSVIEEVQKLPYHMGNIFSTSLSLSNVRELSLELTDEQRNSLKRSEIDFLKTSFASLPKSSKDAIIAYLKELAEKIAVVLECLFYYTRTGELEKFFQSQNFDAILNSYQRVIDIHQDTKNFIYDGPYDSVKMNHPVSTSVDHVFWKVTNKSSGKTWILRGTASPELLNSESQVGKDAGLNFSVLDNKGKEISEEFQRFPVDQLEIKMEDLIKK